MENFINDDFMLYNEPAKELYHHVAAPLAIIDYHNHLSAKEIYEDKSYENLTEVWLGDDHYKWRAMRAAGVSEQFITGQADAYEKFQAWARTVQQCLGNPLYHWTHLELARYFGIYDTLSPETASAIWKQANEKLRKGLTARKLLKMQKVEVLCTTDDPADTLIWHQRLAKEKGLEGMRVLPTFRPDKAICLEQADFLEYLQKLGKAAKVEIDSVAALLAALTLRLEHFMRAGCCVTDHSLEGAFFAETNEVEVEDIFRRRLKDKPLTIEEQAKYKGYLLARLGRLYAARGLVMQLHIGALRNNSLRGFRQLGVDTGFDSMNDFSFAPQLSSLLDAMDRTGELPKTVIYSLNPKDTPMLAAMAGNFQGNEKGIQGKVQLGAAWWFCDHAHGMVAQMQALMDVGILTNFIGMLTDSRSLLSFSRHEYFRRILCNMLGGLVEKGQYPRDMKYLKKVVKDICYDNAKKYFSL